MRQVRFHAAVIAGVLCLACSARAQTTVNIWPGAAPGPETWTWYEKVFRNVRFEGTDIGTVYEDVVTPTLTLYLPSKAKATGAGIIIAPGGGCLALATQSPGKTARWLQRRGIAAFILKYRLQRKTGSGSLPGNLNEDVACKWGIADGVQALKVVRERAAPWGVSPHRLGFMGFSAGGMISAAVLTQGRVSDRPDFAGLFYGAPFASMPAIPAKLPSSEPLSYRPLPPVFMAWAQDDAMAAPAMRRFFRLLVAEGYQPEAHIYDAGGHGFAESRPRTSSRHWLQEFYWWLQARGFIKPAS